MYELAINLPIHNEEKSITHVINEWVDDCTAWNFWNIKKVNFDNFILLKKKN